jgi:hypothetical protein
MKSASALKAGRHEAAIPVRVLYYRPEERDRWRAMWAAWEASDRTDWTAWREHRRLARSGRVRFAHRKNPSPHYYFGEMLAARNIEREGYTCWSAHVCGIAQAGVVMKRQAPETERVSAMLAEQKLPFPSEYRQRLDFDLAQPDLTAFRPTNEWRFAEVKVGGDRLRHTQLQTLAFLHHLLGAEVEVVRVVPAGTQVHRLTLPCTYRVR